MAVECALTVARNYLRATPQRAQSKRQTKKAAASGRGPSPTVL